jgi:diadenosine tetraphosphatase ApaH/serine/threonine PP2A family protein phosphatase
VRILIISDVHANLAALEAVLADAEAGSNIDAVWNLGDAVGYGPRPAECIDRLRGLNARWVAGNHERAATGAIGTEDFNAVAARAADWTRENLSVEDKAFLDTLPEVLDDDEAVLVHGTLREPIWEYLLDADSAMAHFGLAKAPLSFVGHTHLPMLVTEDGDSPEGCQMRRLRDGDSVSLGDGRRKAINPGSVGQPRDGDPRASYGIYDSDAAKFTLHRIDYDIPATQALMAAAGLPEWLAERLGLGR